MAKANKKARKKNWLAIMTGMPTPKLSYKDIRLANQMRKDRLKLTNKAVKGSATKAFLSMLEPLMDTHRKPQWQKHEEQIRRGYTQNCVECGKPISKSEFDARSGVCMDCWGQIKSDEQKAMRPKRLPFSGGE